MFNSSMLIREKRNHLKLEAKPPRSPNNAAAHVLEEYPHQLAISLERKDILLLLLLLLL